VSNMVIFDILGGTDLLIKSRLSAHFLRKVISFIDYLNHYVLPFQWGQLFPFLIILPSISLPPWIRHTVPK